MTFLEKYKTLHKDRLRLQDETLISKYCPSELGYEEQPHKGFCSTTTCTECWDREAPQEYFDQELQDIVADTIEGKFTTATPIIKDSGDRTEFETGAVRDMREGKGRCDLMPLDVVARVFGGTGDGSVCDTVIDQIAAFQHTGDIGFLYYALKIFCQLRYGDASTMLLETAIHFEEGAKKYGPDNWRLGIDVYCYIDSAIRHYLKWQRGDADEPHDRAFAWNILCAIWTCRNKPELNSYAKEE